MMDGNSNNTGANVAARNFSNLTTTMAANVTASNYSNMEDMEDMGPPLYMYIYVTILNVLVFLVGVLGNLLVIQVVARTKSMRRRMNYFLVSLSIADLQILVIGLPMASMEFYSKDRWYLGDFMCPMERFLENTSHYCSVLTLLAIGFERYYAICHPLREAAAARFTSPRILIPIVWIVSCLISTPFAFISYTKEETFMDNTVHDVCFTDMHSTLVKVYLALAFSLFLALPLLLLTVMYSAIIMTLAATHMLSGSNTCGGGGSGGGSAGNSANGSLNSLHHPARSVHRVESDRSNNSRAITSRRQVVRMMVAVMALYFFCLSPLRCFQLWVTFTTPQQFEKLGFLNFLNIGNCLRILIYINSAGNPIIYGLLSTNFRSAFRKSISCYSNRLDGYRYNTTYYNSNNTRRISGPGGHHESMSARQTHVTFASPKHSNDNLTTVSCADQQQQTLPMLPLTEYVPGTRTRGASVARQCSEQGNDSPYSTQNVIINPTYQNPKQEMYSKQIKKNGNVYV